MRSLRWRNACGFLVALAAVPAMAIVVVDEDFDDDTPSSYDPVNTLEPGLEGLPTNDGKPGRWLPNQYDQLPWFNNPWHDDLDANPDTNWQLQVTENIGPDRAGNEAFYQNQHWDCPFYIHCVEVVRDCATIGLTEPGPCDNDRFSRDGFLQFTLADGTPRPAVTGETVKGKFDFTYFDGIPVFALSRDIQQMAADTGDEDQHPPLTKWSVGFGQTLNAMDEGLEAWSFPAIPQHPDVVSLLGMANGHNGREFDVYVPNPDQPDVNQVAIQLDPDFERAYSRQNTEDPDGNDYPYATLAFEYTVGNTVYDLLTIDNHDDMGPQEVRQALDEGDGSGLPPDPGGPVPIGRPEATSIDGFVFTDTGEKMAAYMIDNICFVIDGSLDDCGAEPTVLIGDANKDGLVTGADLISVQQSFGSTGSAPLQGDANNDGLVTGADLISVQQNFGAVASAASIPEPATAVLVGLGLLAATGRRRRA